MLTGTSSALSVSSLRSAVNEKSGDFRSLKWPPENISGRMMLFIYLFYSRDSAIHPQEICGLGNTEGKTSSRPLVGLLQPSALGGALCASLGVRAPLTKESGKRKGRRKTNKGDSKLTHAPRGGLHRFPCHLFIHPRGIGPIFVRPVRHHSSHSRQF
jgi:hypothetical protein